MDIQLSPVMSCPLTVDQGPRVMLAHGGGGRLMNNLIRDRIQVVYPDRPRIAHDSAVFSTTAKRLAMSTDSYVVSPLFFPGSDIGKLAVYGTVNDLAMAGATPQYLSLALILEEGLPFTILDRVLHSIREALAVCDVEVITGDTKVVERGKADGLYINTTGIGCIADAVNIHPGRIQDGDVILISGDIGRHGVAVMNVRLQTSAMASSIESDCAPLHRIVGALIAESIDLHCLRDLTRGGLAAALAELAAQSGFSAILRESAIPIHPEVAAYCELLGLEAYHIANEGRFVCIVSAADEVKCLEILQGFSSSEAACCIGRFSQLPRASIVLQSDWGSERLLPMSSGELFPRIC